MTITSYLPLHAFSRRSSLLSISRSRNPANTSIDYLPSFLAASSGMLASLACLPEELLEPILREAIEPGTKRGADILFVNHVFHRIGRPFLYRLVELASQEAYDSYFLLGSSTLWRPSVWPQRVLDYARLERFTLSFGPYKKVPFSLSSLRSAFIPSVSNSTLYHPHTPLFPRLAAIVLDMAQGASYLNSRPKPLSRRVAKLIGTFSPRTLVLARTSSAEISLASILPHHLVKTERLFLASHHVSHLPSITARTAPRLWLVVVEPYPAVRLRDLQLLCTGLKGSGVRIEVRWAARGTETWWDREMEQEIEGQVNEARLTGKAWAEEIVFRYREVGEPDWVPSDEENEDEEEQGNDEDD